jgi:formylglycine-generating enzyme required for sulfatase activity
MMGSRSFRNSVGIEFVWIDPGAFLMGATDGDPDANANECPQHGAAVVRGFYMARFPITLGQYRRLVRYEAQEFSACEDEQAVNFVSCEDADRWVSALNASRPDSEQSYTYRLPTETEWEYCCRAGTSTRFSYGDDPGFELLGEYAWFSANTWDLGAKHPQRVGGKRPNAFGLYDMHGNVWEWTSDGWALYDEILAHGEAVRDPTLRVLRGGGWCHEGRYQRASDRDHYEPKYRHYYTGFRVCCDVLKQPAAFQGPR